MGYKVDVATGDHFGWLYIINSTSKGKEKKHITIYEVVSYMKFWEKVINYIWGDIPG